jgi:hypothetical protein
LTQTDKLELASNTGEGEGWRKGSQRTVGRRRGPGKWI